MLFVSLSKYKSFIYIANPHLFVLCDVKSLIANILLLVFVRINKIFPTLINHVKSRKSDITFGSEIITICYKL